MDRTDIWLFYNKIIYTFVSSKYLFPYTTIITILSITESVSATPHETHSPSSPNIADNPNIHTDRITNVLTPDNNADIAPFENAVNIPDTKILYPVNIHAGIVKIRHPHVESKNSLDSPCELKNIPAILLLNTATNIVTTTVNIVTQTSHINFSCVP